MMVSPPHSNPYHHHGHPATMMPPYSHHPQWPQPAQAHQPPPPTPTAVQMDNYNTYIHYNSYINPNHFQQHQQQNLTRHQVRVETDKVEDVFG